MNLNTELRRSPSKGLELLLGFFLLLMVKWEKKEELKEEFLKEQDLMILKILKCLQMTKDPKRKKWMPKSCHREKAKCVMV